MKFTEKIQGLISRGEIQDASTNMLEDTIGAVLGDPISVGKIMLAIGKSPFFIREQLFWTKMEAFLNGVYLNENDCAKLRSTLTSDGEKQDNALRLVESIDRAETQQKIRYLINATRCLLTDFIDRSTYFRICHAVTHTLEEDLTFLGEHIKESDLSYNSCIQGLLTSGLMYQSVIDGNGDQKYSFTPIAELIDRYAISYENVERYPNPIVLKPEQPIPQISIPAYEWQTFEKKEVEKALSEI